MIPRIDRQAERLPLAAALCLRLFLLFRHWNFALLLFKFLNTFANEIQNLAVSAAAFLSGNIVQLVVQCGVNLNTQMFVVFVPHKFPLKYAMMFTVYVKQEYYFGKGEYAYDYCSK